MRRSTSGIIWHIYAMELDLSLQDQTRIAINSTELIDLNWFIFAAKLIELIRLLFHVSWLVTESIRFHKVGDLVDCIWRTCMIESSEFIQNF